MNPWKVVFRVGLGLYVLAAVLLAVGFRVETTNALLYGSIVVGNMASALMLTGLLGYAITRSRIETA
jgi:hypothetical protein